MSSEAMERAQKLVAEDKENGMSTDTGSPLLLSNGKRQHLVTGFKTASGSELIVSSEAMERAQKLVAEDKKNGMSTDTGSPLLVSNRKRQHLVTGFKTASGSELIVSSEAMERAQKLVAEDKENGMSTDIDSPLLNSSRKQHLVTGFKTASGLKLVVSSEAMEKAQKCVDEDKENGIPAGVGSSLLDPIRRKERVVTGFKIASGRGLSTSASSNGPSCYEI